MECIDGEPDNPLITVKVYSGERGAVKKIIEHIYNIYLDYNSFLKTVREYPILYRIALKHRGLRPALVCCCRG